MDFKWIWIPLLLIIDHHTVRTQNDSPVAECEYWERQCEEYRDLPNKGCFGDVIYLYQSFQGSYHNARFQCQSAFNGYQNADMLYLLGGNSKNYGVNDQNFKKFVAKQRSNFPKELMTSGICCSTFANVDPSSHTPVVSCEWPVDRGTIEPDPSDPSNPITQVMQQKLTECKFVNIQVETQGQGDILIRYLDTHPLSENSAFTYVCSYRRPGVCPTKPPSTTSTTTPTSQTMTSKPTRTTTTTTSTTTTSPTHTTPSTSTPPSHDKQCEREERFSLKFGPTKRNSQSVVKCPDGYEGKATWNCDENGHWDKNGPDVTNCTRMWMKDAIDRFNKAKNMDQLQKLAEDMKHKLTANGTSDKAVVFPNDLHQMDKAVDTLQSKSNSLAPHAQLGQVRDITDSVVNFCDMMISSDTAWKHHGDHKGKKDKVRIAANILKHVQMAGVTFGCSEADNSREANLTTRNSNIYLEPFNMDNEQPIYFEHAKQEFRLTNSIHQKDHISEVCKHKIGVGAVFRNLSRYLTEEGHSEDRKMNSEIVAFSYNNHTTVTVRLPGDTQAMMGLTHQSRLEFGDKALCVFWNFASKSWDSTGCWLSREDSSRKRSQCVCNHLTNFAVIMDISGREKPSTVKSILSIVTCGASVVCLLLTIFFFSICRELKNRRSIITINMSAVLVIIDLLVIFGLDRTENKMLCKSVSVLLLYFLLALFSWMLMEGYHLYQMIILVFSNIGHLKMLYLYLIGYGAPAIIAIVGSVVIALKTELTNEYFCWITSTKYPYQIWVLAGPATLIIIINTVIMVIVMRTAYDMKFAKNPKMAGKHSSSAYTTSSYMSSSSKNSLVKNLSPRNGSKGVSRSRSNQSDSSDESLKAEGGIEAKMAEWISYLKGYLSLMVLMGITWICYVLYIHEFGHFFSYVFIVLNGLQGVFIFATQFLFNKKAMNAVRKRLFWISVIESFRSSSSSKNTTSSSYASSTRKNSRPSISNPVANPDGRNESIDWSGSDIPMNFNHNNNQNNLLINRSTSMEYF